ncbi:GNAT family N-acetyltransferase [Haloferula sp.]|uniref:GNAT family N-acetyltransferase n=1 Tax=Haloferula sp. TaxID=2497595 RepID=UPI003C770150
MSENCVRPLQPKELRDAVRLLAFLNPDCSSEVLVDRFETIVAEHPHYHPLGAFTEGKMVAFAGAWIATKVWCGRYLEVDNLVVHPDYRSKGFGSSLIKHCEQLAKQHGCNLLVLDSYTSNHPSHRLYHRFGFEIWGFHFVKQIASFQR